MIKKKDNAIIFISKTSSVILQEKSDIVLSPEFYWVVQKNLPIKYPWQAKKLAPSIFDGLLPEGDYQFKAIQDGELFYLFAYDNAYIMDHLKKIITNIEFIDNIYFVQNELPKYSAYACFDNKILYPENNIFILLPEALIDKENIPVKKPIFEKLSKYKISLDTYSSFIDKKSFNFLVIVLMMLITFNMIEAFYYKNRISQIQVHAKSLFTTYQLPSTSWQIDAIKKRITEKNTTQLNLRKSLYKIFDLRLKEDEFMTHMNADKSGITLIIALKEAIRAEDIKKELIEKGFKLKNAKVSDLLFTIELSYE